MSTAEDFPPPVPPATPTGDGSTTSTSSTSKVDEAKDAAKGVASDAKAEAASVVRQAKDQVSSLKGQASDELRRQAEDRGQQAAGQLRSLSDQLGALADGRPDGAGPLAGYLDEGRQRVDALATRLEQQGPQGLMDDVASLGRRRPGLFLLGAVVAGVAVGRLVRAGASSDDDGDGDMSTSGGFDAGSSDLGTYSTDDVATGSLETDVYVTDLEGAYVDPTERPR